MPASTFPLSSYSKDRYNLIRQKRIVVGYNFHNNHPSVDRPDIYQRLAPKPRSCSFLRHELIGLYNDGCSQSKAFRIRAFLKKFGRRLAKSGVMRNKPIVPAAVVDWILANRTFIEDSPMFLTSNMVASTLLGRDVTALWDRDSEKLSDGRWRPVPWHHYEFFKDSRYFLLHSLHMSTTKGEEGLLAFAESLDKMRIERYTIIKPGRYLARFFPELGESEIRTWTERVAASIRPAELKFIESDDKDGWVSVYQDGPDSCMSGSDAECVHVYAHKKSVLRLAYLVQGEDIKGRAIVREDKKEYIRCYPNTNSTDSTAWHNTMREAIEAAGYTHGNLEGVLLDMHKADDGEYTMPYLDSGSSGPQSVDMDGEYFRVTKHGEHDATNTNGRLSLRDMMSCDSCNDDFDAEDMNYIDHHDHHVCNYCYSEHYREAIGRRGRTVMTLADDCVYCSSDDNHYVTEYASDNEVYECAESGDYFKLDDMVATPDGWVADAHATKLTIKTERHGEEFEYAGDSDVVTTHSGDVVYDKDVITYVVDDINYICHEDVDEMEFRAQLLCESSLNEQAA